MLKRDKSKARKNVEMSLWGEEALNTEGKFAPFSTRGEERCQR